MRAPQRSRRKREHHDCPATALRSAQAPPTESDLAADLNLLAVAARQAWLSEAETNRTPESARRTGEPRPAPPGHQAEGAA